MNFDRAIFVINENVRAIKVEYEPDVVAAVGKSNTSLFKTLDHRVQVDDFVIVPTNSRANMTVAQVVDVDVAIEIKTGGPIPWLIGVVDAAKIDEHEKLKKMEDDAITKLKAVEKQNERRQLKADLEAYQKDAISGLEIAQIGGPAPEAPPAPPSDPDVPEIQF